jgi:hypothetical protein
MLENVFREKTVQVSFVSGVLFFLIAHKDVLKMVSDLVKKTLKVKLDGNYLLALHSALFAVLVGFLTYNVFVPLLGWNAEGQDDAPMILECDEGYADDGTGVCKPIDEAATAEEATTEGLSCEGQPEVCEAPTYCGGQFCRLPTATPDAPDAPVALPEAPAPPPPPEPPFEPPPP